MASTYSALKYELMATGEDDGTWGDKTNANILAIQDTLSATGQISLASADFVVPFVDSSAQQAARGMRFAVIGTSGGATRTITMPAVPKLTVFQNAVADALIFKNSGGAGATFTLPSGKTSLFYSDGVNMISAITYSPNLAIDALAVGSSTFFLAPTFSNGIIVAGSATSTFSGPTQFNNNVGISSGNLFLSNTAIGSILKIGTGNVVQAATPGTDFAVGTSPTNWSALQTYFGTVVNSAIRIANGSETNLADPVALNGAYTWDVSSTSIIWAFQGGLTGDFSLNIRGSSSTPLWQFIPVGDFITITFIVNQAGTTFKLTSINFNGVTPSFVYWAGGAGQPLPKVSSNSVYTFAIRNVGSGGNHQVFASMTTFN